ncbi:MULTISPECIES: regulatory protein RecX [unclassified Oscillibacter]|uniref:regulatory protein RecX n=1 Tax=unclassified Oscillibacter TaxID=2629304 RepID=UPI0025DB4440|nr:MULTISPECIES: regulatory protein RecX [unclassified Oscillibacter]
MKIDRLERSKHVSGRVLVFLEDGTLLKITEQELLDFGLRAGDELDEETLGRLKASASGSDAKARAAELIGRRAMSRRDLERKLTEKGASETEARYAAEWLEAIGALDDGEYSALLVRHCAEKGYGPARYRDELYKHGVPRELWEDAMSSAPDPADMIAAYLQDRFRKSPPDERERRRAADALARRGFGWSDVRTGLSAWAELPDDS